MSRAYRVVSDLKLYYAMREREVSLRANSLYGAQVGYGVVVEQFIQGDLKKEIPWMILTFAIAGCHAADGTNGRKQAPQ